MTALTYLANLCCQIDTVYSVSLCYGADSGDVPRWYMRVVVPVKGIVLSRSLVRGDDIGANLEAARSLGEDLKRIVPSAFHENPFAARTIDAKTLSLGI